MEVDNWGRSNILDNTYNRGNLAKKTIKKYLCKFSHNEGIVLALYLKVCILLKIPLLCEIYIHIHKFSYCFFVKRNQVSPHAMNAYT